MTQKQRSLFVIKALMQESANRQTSSEGTLLQAPPELLSYFEEKIDAVMYLERPEVVLSQEARQIYDKLVEQAKTQGRIV
jgi:hypothetical protein